MNYLTQQQEVRSRLRLDLADGDQATLIKRWLNQSQQEIWNAYEWPWSLDREIVQTVADKTAGTVSIDSGATTVTGVSTAFASGDVGKYIQFSSSNDWYKITASASATSLTIEAAYTATSNLSAGTYTIRKFFYSTSSSVDKVLTMRQAIGPDILEMIHYRDFDIFRPNPTSTGNPNTAIVFGYESSGNLQFTPYPWPSVVMNLEVRFKKRVTELSGDTDTSTIPIKWHSTTMIDGALYRGYQYTSIGQNVQDNRAELQRRVFQGSIKDMIAECEPDVSYHPVLQTREVYNAPVGPRLPNKFGFE